MTTTERKVALAIELGRAMHDLKNHVRQVIQDKLKACDTNITFEMLEIMWMLWDRDGVNQQEIADKTLRDKSSMTYLIDNLVKRGMVKRVEDKKDRRNKLIFLTGEAVKLKDQLCPWLTEVYTQATTDSKIDDLQASIEQLKRMISNLRQDNTSSH
ncbi:MarR family transcriptional regulator [Mucilaginibacter limnophilus]|uniref:MarR family transcriptional regulator n=1 Tax=Mucilaginibacter limnophilus TaxID=1932778 RepID=A0A3S2VLZ4_9SPHI|nr:MarR family transcriptional regulator [Mucilaginibacter limnophilus]RVU00414.1 MarR family transcriptional regulator [Mucilaginibacter limnophilus]